MGKEMFVDDETQTDGEYKVKERKANWKKRSSTRGLEADEHERGYAVFFKSLDFVHHSQ